LNTEILAGKPEVKRNLGRNMWKLEKNIDMDLVRKQRREM
jgi:hypothetical protein